jgi:hypothetical protein
MLFVFVLGTAAAGQRLLKLRKDTYSHAAPGVASMSGMPLALACAKFCARLQSHTISAFV